MKTNTFFIITLFFICSRLFTQSSSDNQYQKPLLQVLKEMEQKYTIKLKYKEDEIKDKTLKYADWRQRTDIEISLANVLAPFDMVAVKQSDGSYKIKYYEYSRRSVKEGKEQLDQLSSLYNDTISWLERRNELQPCILEAMKLSPLPAKPESKIILTPKRIYTGYSIENFALETLPGLYVCGSIYRPAKYDGKIPVILNPNGHWDKGRYRPDQQYRCAMEAQMGAIAVSYDCFAWGESLLQFKSEDHRRSLAQSIQVLNSIRILDYLLTLEEADPIRVGITGGSGGGSHALLVSAIDERIRVVVPVVSLSCYFFGGCPCESGMPIHFCRGGTNNVELAAIVAPRPLLVVSDGQDWTDHTPEIEFPYLQKMYSYYGSINKVKNVHLPNEGHSYGIAKRQAMYPFMAEHLKLNIEAFKDSTGNIDESNVTIEEESAMYAFGLKGENLPANAIKSFEKLEKMYNK